MLLLPSPEDEYSNQALDVISTNQNPILQKTIDFCNIFRFSDTSLFIRVSTLPKIVTKNITKYFYNK